MTSTLCEYCQHEVPLAWNHCPHCARPGLFPNVKAAQTPAEKDALEKRYQKARRNGAARGADLEIENFEKATATSKAVLARPARELDRLAASPQELFSTYYKLLEAEVRLPHGNQWDLLRAIADEALFPGYKREIQFAALSLDGVGLSNYGECSFVLRDDMIAHRASAFEANSALLMKRKKYELPPGFRATWEERAKLCVAKLAEKINSGAPESQFVGLLLQAGPTSQDDSFIEVHVWGPMSLWTVERVVLSASGRKSFRKALRDRLKAVGVVLEEVA